MGLEIKIGLDSITSYRRLRYTIWHALAEFVDNSTQAYFDHREEMDAALAHDNRPLTVSIVHETGDSGVLRIGDNSIGMSYADLQRALHIACPPPNPTGRSRYGMGLKTAACWLGNRWSIRTKRLGETVEHRMLVDVEAVATGQGDIPYECLDQRREDAHYTVIEVSHLNQPIRGAGVARIKQFLSSMYREDIRKGLLRLEWQLAPLAWEDPELMTALDGTPYRKDFDFHVDNKRVWGWVGLLSDRGRAKAGFSVLHSGRVIMGWPQAWRPPSIYGEERNDLVNQRLVGEINLDQFEVTHTKDWIVWQHDEEPHLLRELKKQCASYATFARSLRVTTATADPRGPSEAEKKMAVAELEKELSSPEMVDVIDITAAPPTEEVTQTHKVLTTKVTAMREPTFRATIGGVTVKGFIVSDLSPNDPYVMVDCPSDREVVVVVNEVHPYWGQLGEAGSLLDYLRHCTYDAVAEWKALRLQGRLDANTLKLLKDSLLRVAFYMEMHESAAVGEDEIDEADEAAAAVTE